MRTIGRRLTYANVVSTLALFLVVAGGAAYAVRVPKKSVGPRQLKANAVTTAKIKANSVTTRKIKRNAVTNAKIRDGSVEGAKIIDGSVALGDLAQGTLPYARVVQRARGYSGLAITAAYKLYPLGDATYVQAAGESDSFLGALDVGFPPECTSPRWVEALLLLDSDDPLSPKQPEIVAGGLVEDEAGAGSLGSRVEIGPFREATGTSFEPNSPRFRKLNLVVRGFCTAGSGIYASFGGVNVIATK